jgi:hypothetical protein
VSAFEERLRHRRTGASSIEVELLSYAEIENGYM